MAPARWPPRPGPPQLPSPNGELVAGHGLPNWRKRTPDLALWSEADEGTRTPDPLLTMEVLYQLSYVGVMGQLTA